MKAKMQDRIVWVISLILAILALLGHFASIPVLTTDQFWILLAAWFIVFIRLAKRK
jgi:hypothetical protein